MSYIIILTNKWTNNKMAYTKLFDSEVEAKDFVEKEMKTHVFPSKNWTHEVEPVGRSTRREQVIEEFCKYEDVRIFLLCHPNPEAVRMACRHYLGIDEQGELDLKHPPKPGELEL